MLLAMEKILTDSFQLKEWRIEAGAMQSFPYRQAGGPPCQAPEAGDLIGAQCPTILLYTDD